jgi:1-acyl-sn-glycerol-3-phosphate acyltransferase
MLILRSVLFNLAFYINLLVQMIIFTPFYFVAPRRYSWIIANNWIHSSNWLLKVIVGTTHEIEGLENLPEGGCILAPKHQSTWDTIALIPHYRDPFYILKRELTWIPLFGWYVMKMRMVPINRGSRSSIMAEMVALSRERMEGGRQLVIYPEGTRRPVGADPEYKYGVARLYEELDVPVVPIAMNPGLFWPRRKLMRYPGVIRVRILEPIQPGMAAEEFFGRLIDVTESATNELMVQTINENPHLPVPETAAKRYRDLTGQDPRAR